jgi:DNA-directed RNA polymerase specialized sigma subunit
MVIQRELSLFRIKDLSNQIFDYLSLTFYDLETQLDSKLDLTKIKLDTFADKHFNGSIKDLLKEADQIKGNFPEIFEQIKETTNELRLKFDQIIDKEYIDFTYINKLRSDLNNYIEKIKFS